MIFNMVGGGGGSGATLVVSSPVNVSVTVSKDDKSYTKNSGSLGSTTFKGLATGTWTVTISGNGQTATKTIEITADYAITIAFFSATINITYPANSNCVVTNSGGQTVASDTNTGSSTKTWTATVNATGTYTVTATATDGSGKSKSTTVSITADGQSVNLSISYILDLWDYARDGLQGLKDISVPDKAYGNSTANVYRERTDCVYITNSVAGKTAGIIFPNVDISNYEKIKITGYGTQGGFGITDAADTVNLIASFRFSNNVLTEVEFPITVSSGYLCSWSDIPETATYVNVSKILLE